MCSGDEGAGGAGGGEGFGIEFCIEMGLDKRLLGLRGATFNCGPDGVRDDVTPFPDGRGEANLWSRAGDAISPLLRLRWPCPEVPEGKVT